MYAGIFKNFLFPFYESFFRGRKTLKYLAELEENQWLSREELLRQQWLKLKRLLYYAYENVPYYHRFFNSNRIHPDQIRQRTDFLSVPYLTKPLIRANMNDLVARAFQNRRSRLYQSWTGGSTGEPLTFYYDRTSYEWRIAAAARSDRWCGWDFGVKELYVWGERNGRLSPARRLKKYLHHQFLRRLIFNSYTFSEATFPEFTRKMHQWKPEILVAYTSALYQWALYLKRQGISPVRPKAIIATAEQLFPYQKEVMEEVFQAPVYNRYGAREVMLMAMECEYRLGLHLNTDNLYIEIIKDNHPAGPGETGEVVVTDLNNYAMPMIRYKIGDLAVVSDRMCPCGRGLPLLESVQGRLFDTIITPDGRYVTGLFFTHLLHEFEWVQQFQVIQKTPQQLRIKIVGKESGTVIELELQRIRFEIQKQLGRGMRVDFDMVEKIPLEASGKLRITKSEVTAG